MSKHKIGSPNDSLQQSTREPSALPERASLGVGTFTSSGSTRGFLANGPSVGGGTYKSYMLDHLGRMFADIEATTRRLELERRRLHKLDKDLVVAQGEFAQKKLRYGAFTHMQESAVQHRLAQVRQLERQLEKDIADLNKGSMENEKLRGQIDDLRKERMILDTVFKQLERGIGNSRKAIERLKSAISEDRQQGDDAKQRADALVKMLEKERRGFHKRTDDMRKAVQKETEVQREQEKLARSTERDGMTRGRNRRAYMVADEEEAFSEQAMHRRILKLSFLNTIQRRHIKQHQKNIEVFEQAFATIKSSTGISDIEEIVKIFIALEQRNFSLLTYVNQLNREIEAVEIRNRELQDQLRGHQQRETQTAARRETALSEVVAQIGKTKAATQEKDRMVAEAAAALDECRPLVWHVVKLLREELPPLVRAGYEGEAPPLRAPPPDEHDNHLPHHLTFIEEALMLFRVCLAQDPMAKGPTAKLLTAVGKKPSDLPSAHLTGDDSDDDPDAGLGDRPWTRTELRERALVMIARRRKKPGQQGAAKLPHEERRADAAEDAADATRRDPAAFKENGDGLPGAATKGPTKDRPSGGSGDAGDEEGDRKGTFRDEMWWRGQSGAQRR